MQIKFQPCLNMAECLNQDIVLKNGFSSQFMPILPVAFNRAEHFTSEMYL